MMRRQIVANALTTFGQIMAGSVVLFFLYRFLIRAIGIERLGIWSLVLASTSVITLANQGFSAGIVKYVAKHAARGQEREVAQLMETSVLAIGFALGTISAALYPLIGWILTIVLPHRNLGEALAILPLALVSLWLTIIQGALQGGLAGLHRITICNYLEVSGSISYLVLAYLLVPRYGLSGLACAQTLQAAATLGTTWLLLRRLIKSLPLIPCRFSRPHFREVATYGLHFQLITASQALREPVTKALLTKFGGVALTGLYDMANRLVFGLRELLAQGNMVLIPAVSHLQERDPQSIPGIYRESYRLMFFLAVPSFSALAVLSPLVSRIWIGRYEMLFVEFVGILAAGWLVNVLCNPAYVIALGTGSLRWVTVGCLSTALLNATLGYFAGSQLGGIAVVAANAASLAFGYLVLLTAYQFESGTSVAALLPRESGGILLVSALGVLFLLPFLCTHSNYTALRFRATAGAVVAMIALIAATMWFHPMRARLLNWVFARVPA